MTEPLLEVRNITKLFGSVIALSDVSAKVYSGEVTCLLGDNGAGKSTLIKIRRVSAHGGEYLFGGRPRASPPASL
jgi:simple sugar transport system ATP-binding protein